MDSGAAQMQLRGLRALLAPRSDPYAGIDLESRKRVGGMLILVALALGTGLVAVYPPTEAIGDTGWAVASLVFMSSLAMAFLVLRPGSRMGFDGMLVTVYVGVFQVAVLEWLAGGHGTSYHWLYLSAAVFPPSIHPPRRAVGIVLACTVAVAAPLAYAGWSTALATDIALQVAFMWLLAFAAMTVMDAVREHSLRLQRERADAHRLARRDSLTGLGNRRAFDEALQIQAANASLFRPLSLVVIDLDDFKAINDEHGHQRGDLVLKEVAAALRASVRAPDHCFRWGGDEFSILLANAAPDTAVAVAARVRNAIGTSVSCGVATLCDPSCPEELLATADSALRGAKAAA